MKQPFEKVEMARNPINRNIETRVKTLSQIWKER